MFAMPIYLLTSFTFSPMGTEVACIIFLLSTQQPCEVSEAESMWLAHGHPARFHGTSGDSDLGLPYPNQCSELCTMLAPYNVCFYFKGIPPHWCSHFIGRICHFWHSIRESNLWLCENVGSSSFLVRSIVSVLARMTLLKHHQCRPKKSCTLQSPLNSMALERCNFL